MLGKKDVRSHPGFINLKLVTNLSKSVATAINFDNVTRCWNVGVRLPLDNFRI